MLFNLGVNLNFKMCVEKARYFTVKKRKGTRFNLDKRFTMISL